MERRRSGGVPTLAECFSRDNRSSVDGVRQSGGGGGGGAGDGGPRGTSFGEGACGLVLGEPIADQRSFLEQPSFGGAIFMGVSRLWSFGVLTPRDNGAGRRVGSSRLNAGGRRLVISVTAPVEQLSKISLSVSPSDIHRAFASGVLGTAIGDSNMGGPLGGASARALR